MRKLIIASLTILLLTACSSPDHNGCVQVMQEDGYSFEEAESACSDAEYESQIQ